LSSAVDDWDLAPCGLLEIDRDSTIIRANQRFLARTGYTRQDLEDGLTWPALMTPAGRIFFENQLAPMLALNGSIDEILIELVCPGGRRLPVLVSAETGPMDASPADRRTRLALMTVPDRQQYERQLREARRQAEVANAENLQVRNRLQLLANANTALASSLDVSAALHRLARVLVTELGDWCLLYALDPDHPYEISHWSAAHTDPERQADVDRLALLLPAHGSEHSMLKSVLRGADPIVVSDVTPDLLRAATSSDEVYDLCLSLDLRSTMVVPSRARAQQAAVIILGRGAGRPQFTPGDLAEVTELADRTGIAIDNLRLYAREHSMSVALQKALLTPLPVDDRLEIASRYEPGANGTEVGGDWYDAFRQADGTTVAVVGDVTGHDIEAAAAMGHLRSVIRTIGHTTSGSPAQTLEQADRAADGLQVRVIASAVVAAIRATTRVGGPSTFALQWSSAGHPPPLIVRRSGSVDILDAPPGLLLGVFPDRARRNFEVDLAPGDTLLLYTDGLVERRDEDLEDSIAALARHLGGSADRHVDELCDIAVRHRPSGNNDDVALLAVRIKDDPSSGTGAA
jgi:hypothetical protein